MSLLLEAARTLMAGSSLSYCQLSLGGPLVLVVLSCVCSSMYHCVGLLGFRACLEWCTAVSLYMCVVTLACSYLVVSPCCVYYNCYHCVSVSRRKMLLIPLFLNMVVYLSLSVLVGVSLVKLPNVCCVV